jgi:hypothetical protein
MQLTTMKPVLIAALLTLFALPAAANENNSARRSTSAIPRTKILKISDQIDAIVAAQLSSRSQELNPLSSDEVFLRRAYLDIVGRIPSIDETQRFLKSSSKNKRADLIDDLLDSYGFVSHQFNFYADLLRIKSRLPGNIDGVSYIDFVKDSLEENKPYDQFVRELVSSQGPNLERGNGSVGYYLRDRNMPEDNMSNTIRIFLGTRLECAQCHDHPFDKWTQRQYFEMVAFTGGLQYRAKETSAKANQIRKMYRSKDIPASQRGLFNRMGQTLSYGIEGSGTGLARLPENFLGDDGYDGEIVIGKTMFEGKPLVDTKIPKKTAPVKSRNNTQQAAIRGAIPISSRMAYGEWLTDADNPRFAKVISNRLWKTAFGVALIEPVDIIEDATVASNPELMNYLTETMIDLKFDTKQFLRAIYNSKTYQAKAYDKDIIEVSEFNFNGPIVRRLSAEQIWDSLLTLTLPEIDQRYYPTNRNYASVGINDSYELFERLKNMNTDEILKFVADASDRSKNKKRNYKDTPEYKKLTAERAKIGREIQTAKKRKNVELERKLRIEQAKVLANFRKRTSTSLKRSSELTSPAPVGHFLREFGQSDREQIDNSNTEPAVTQVLAMMNGYVEQKIATDSSSVLMQTALNAKSGKECTESIFLSMLNRKPTRKESRAWEKDFDDASKRKDQAKIKEIYTDLIWTLANSNEFIFIK